MGKRNSALFMSRVAALAVAGMFVSVRFEKSCGLLNEKNLAKKGLKPCEIVKVINYGGVQIGCQYVNMTSNSLNRSQGTPKGELEYTPDPSKYTMLNKWFAEYKTTHNKVLIIGWLAKSNANKDVTWLKDGVQVDYSEVEPYLLAADKLKPHQACQKQLASGIAASEEVIWNTLSVDNISQIDFGGVTIRNI